MTFFISIIFFFGLKIFHSFWPFHSATVVTWHFITIRFAVIVLVPNALMNLLCLVKTILCSLLSTMDLLSWFYSVPFSYFLIWNYKVVCKWEHEIFWTFEWICHAFLIGKGVLDSSSALRKNKIYIFFHYNPNILWQD